MILLVRTCSSLKTPGFVVCGRFGAMYSAEFGAKPLVVIPIRNPLEVAAST